MYDHDEIIRLTRAGLSATQIAARVGCSARQVSRIRVRHGVGQPVALNASRPISAERLAAMGRMVADGASRMEIERTLRVSRHTIERYYPGSGWTSQESGELGRAVRRLYERMRRAA